jgi:hypothetical protein
MPARQPKFMDEVRTNSGGLYVALYYLSEKVDAASVAVDKWFWLRSNASGIKIDERDNKIPVNGASWWSEKSTALANTPVGYGNFSTTDVGFNSTYSLGYMESFPFDAGNLLGYNSPAERTKASFDAMAAAGVDKIFIGIYWDSIFNTYAEQTTNSNTSWAKYDDLINYAKGLTTTKGKPMQIALRLIVSKDDSVQYDLENPANNNGWYGLSNSAKDQLSYPIRVGEGIGHVSLAYSNGLAQVYDFVTKALVRYKNILGSQFLWYSVVTSSQEENGSNYENQYYPTGANSPVPRYPALFDYSSHARTAFKTYCQTKYSNNISSLRTAWGSSYTSFTDIVPPGLGMTGSHEELNTIYRTNKGKDWYRFNEKLVTDFLIACKQIGINNGVAAKFATETGSDTDVLAPRRQTIDIARWASVSDLHKTQLGGLSRDTSFSHSIDLLRTGIARAGKKLGTEANTQDFLTQQGITDKNVMLEAMYEMCQYCILDAEAKDITIISFKYSQYHEVAVSLAQRVRALMDNNVSRVPSVIPQFSYSVEQILDNNTGWLRASMIASGHSLSSRIAAIQSTNGVVTPPVGCNYALQIYPIQTYCLSNNNILTDAYDNDTVLQDVMKNTHFKLWLPTHSITYISGQLTLVSYTVTGADGIVYVKNTQNQGFYTDNQTVNMESPYRNNHPLKQYSGVVTSSIVLLPLGQTYTIQMTNLTPTNQISFVVQNLDINPQADSPTVFQRKVGSTPSSFTFNPNIITSNFIRQVKFNCNRYTDTDTISNIG